jgi:hypothetical protein
MRRSALLFLLALAGCAETLGYAVEVLEGQAARAHPCVRLTEMPPVDPRAFAALDAECMAAVAEARAQALRRR